MSNYIVSARKYRPGTFASVVGQSHVSNTLKSAILLDQLAHAFLFSGPRGVGKTTCARILAKAINCTDLQEDGEPCNQCESCRSYNEGKSINIHELDAASNNSVDDIRNLTEQTRYVPTNGKKSVYIIDEVHMLSQAAFNAFLKTLEEPPAHVLFILATTERHKILPTILSRCQKFDFRRIRVEDIAKHLAYISKEEGIEYEYAALQQIALKADGALRDALSLYDQLVSFSAGKLTFEAVLKNLNILDYDYYFRAVELIGQQDHSGLLLALNEIIEKGFEAKEFIVGLTEHFRNLLVAKEPKTVELIEGSENVKARYLEQSQQMESSLLLNAFHLCSEAEQKCKLAAHPRLVVELVLIKLAHLQSAIKVAANGAETPAPVKKKPLNSPSVAETREPTPAAIPAVPTPDQIKPQQSDIPSPRETPASQQAPVSPVESVSRRKKRGGSVFGSLDAVVAAKEQKKLETSEEKEEENQSYEINPSVQLDRNQFLQVLRQYSERLKSENRMNLASALDNGQTELEHNHWRLIVSNHLSFNVLEKEKTLLPYLREQLGIKDLFLELVVDENQKQDEPEIPYTPEGKLKAMAAENPALQRFQEIFRTRIIY
jgi:DNA polymerase-3 subunit gamma/tau